MTPDVGPVPAAVLFDMDGTLVDSEKLWTIALDDYAAHRGGALSEATRESMVGSNMTRSMVLLLADLGLPTTEDEIRRAADWVAARTAELFATGVANDDPRAQQAIHDHYRWLCNFWTPDRDSYLRLAQLYVNQPKFRMRIERKKPKGMAAYMRDAMTTYAWARLR